MTGRRDGGALANLAIRSGQTIRLVSWHRDHATWDRVGQCLKPALILVEYKRHTKEHWHVLIDGTPVELARDAWEVCAE